MNSFITQKTPVFYTSRKEKFIVLLKKDDTFEVKVKKWQSHIVWVLSKAVKYDKRKEIK